MASVFLSYSRSDETKARKLVAALEASGHSVWWDGMLEGGERFADRIANALNSAEAVVVLWSASSIGSHWVQDEAAHGRDKGILVPVTIDGSEPPLGFRQFQALRLSHWKGRTRSLDIAALSRAIELAAGGPFQANPASPKSDLSLSRRTLLAGSGVAMILGASGLVSWKAGLFTQENSHSVVVLPFRNLSGDPTQDYFAEGLAEEIRNALARNPLLKVIGSPSSKLLREQSRSFSAMASDLSVSHILDGSVRKEGVTARISVTLFAAEGGSKVWSDVFDRQFDRVLEIQAEVATKIAQALEVQRSGFGVVGDGAEDTYAGTTIPAAFDAFMRGRFAVGKGTIPALLEAESQFARAWTIDAKYGAALAAHAHTLIAGVERDPDAPQARERLQKALELATRATKVAPNSHRMRSSRGWALIANMRFGEGLREIVHAYEAYPNDYEVLRAYARNACYIGQFAGAATAIDRALALDPLDAAPWLTKAWIGFWSGKPDQSIAAAEQIFAVRPDFGTRDYLHYFHFANNLTKDRLHLARRAALQVEEKFEREFELAYVELLEGSPDRAKAILASPDQAIDGGTGSYNRLCLQAGLGDAPAALSTLNALRARGDHNLISCRIDPFLNPIRKEPKVAEFIDSLKITI